VRQRDQLLYLGFGDRGKGYTSDLCWEVKLDYKVKMMGIPCTEMIESYSRRDRYWSNLSLCEYMNN
jgi:hypothetical protein